MNKQHVAALVRHYIKDCHPNSMTLEVIEDGIRQEKSWWDVPIRLSMDPPKLYELQEALVNVEIGLKDQENLTVFLEPIFPKPEPSSEPEPPPRPKKRRGRATKKIVAEVVREYLKDCHPGGATLEVVEANIYKSYYEWRVPIRPNFEPPNWIEYYEALAIVATEISENEGLNVHLVPTDPESSENS